LDQAGRSIARPSPLATQVRFLHGEPINATQGRDEMNEERTWSQRLITVLTEIEGEPEWKRYRKETNSYSTDDFAIAKFKAASTEAVTRAITAGLVPLGEGGQTIITLDHNSGPDITVYAELSDAPEPDAS